MVVEPQLFQRQLDALSDTYEIVPAAQLLQDARSSARRPRAALTFDDGYADNAELVAPLLESLGLPATYFLTTAPLGTDAGGPAAEYWWDRLDHLLRDDVTAARLDIAVGGKTFPLALDSEHGRLAAVKTLNRQLVRHHPGVASSVLEQLDSAAQHVHPPCDRHRRMSLEQVAELAARPGVEIGSHTCTHAALGRLSADASQLELTRSRERLAELLGRPPRLIAYPYGAPGTLRRRDTRSAAAAGYDLGFVNVPGPVEGAAPYVVPRVTVGLEEPETLLARLRAWDRQRGRS